MKLFSSLLMTLPLLIGLALAGCPLTSGLNDEGEGGATEGQTANDGEGSVEGQAAYEGEIDLLNETPEWVAVREALCAVVQAQFSALELTGQFELDFDSLTPYLDGTEVYLAGLNGYRFSMAGDGTSFTISADPEVDLITAIHLFADASGVLRYAYGGPANPTEQPYPLQCGSLADPQDFDARALEYLCAIAQAEEFHYDFSGTYTASLEVLTSSIPPYLAGNWTGPLAGHLFALFGDGIGYGVSAEPVAYGVTGTQSYYYSKNQGSPGVLYRASGHPATVDDPEITLDCTDTPPLLNQEWRVVLNNERAVEGLLCRIGAAQTSLFLDNGVYAQSFDELANAGSLDSVYDFTQPVHGYVFTLTGDAHSYQLSADPAVSGRTGYHHFFMDESGSIHSNLFGPASVIDAIESFGC